MNCTGRSSPRLTSRAIERERRFQRRFPCLRYPPSRSAPSAPRRRRRVRSPSRRSLFKKTLLDPKVWACRCSARTEGAPASRLGACPRPGQRDHGRNARGGVHTRARDGASVRLRADHRAVRKLRRGRASCRTEAARDHPDRQPVQANVPPRQDPLASADGRRSLYVSFEQGMSLDG